MLTTNLRQMMHERLLQNDNRLPIKLKQPENPLDRHTLQETGVAGQ
jgi:hypothetical protein